MDDVLSVKVDQALECRPETVLAEALRVLAHQLLEHGCEGAAVHQLHEDPEAVLEVERLMALHDRLTLTHLHDTDLILDSLALSASFRLSELKCKEFTVTDSHTTENSCEATGALFAHYLVEL